MQLPKKLPIVRIENYHTHYLGESAEGRQFWAYETFAFGADWSAAPLGSDWRTFRKEYVVLHTFSQNGHYLTTRYWYAGVTAEASQPAMEQKLLEFVADLGPVVLKDIKVSLFQTQLDGITFGLVVDEKHELINLEPSATISFQEPWDGEYYT